MRRGLIAARKARKLTQAELADILKVHRTALTKYETGAIDIPGRVLTRMAIFFDLPMEDLYAKEPPALVEEQEDIQHATA